MRQYGTIKKWGFDMQAENVWSFIFPTIRKNHDPDPVELIAMIRGGVPGDSIGKVAESLQVPKNQLYELLHMSPRTAQRAAGARLDVEKSDHLVQISKVYARCVGIFADQVKAMKWLKSPNYALGDVVPLSLMDTNEGIELVQDALTRLEYGVYA
jgi:putative toxin-antitoxin system antitoxin component (TIGR02293 family)